MPEHLHFIPNYASSVSLKINVNFINLTSYPQVPVLPTVTDIIDQGHAVPKILYELLKLNDFSQNNFKAEHAG
jgi:hypothetical protein